MDFIGDAELSKIVVRCKTTDKILRTVSFYYSDYNSRLYTRRKLDRIEIAGSDGVTIEKYSFGYYNPQMLPYLNSNAIDHWGYYNNTNNRNALPNIHAKVSHFPYGATDRYETDFFVYNCHKEPHPEAVKYGILNSITYPTGRVSQFDYEINKDLDNKPSGGVRIKKITEINPGGNGLVRVFKYGVNESGKGISAKTITTDDYMYEKLYVNEPTYPKISRARIYRSSPISTFSFSGSAVYYPEVAEYYEENGSSTGKTVYHFGGTYYKQGHIPGTTLFSDPDASWKDGKLVKKVIYKKNGAFTPVQTTTYTYREFKHNTIYIRKIYDRMSFRGDIDRFGRSQIIRENEGFVWDAYYIFSGCDRLVEETNTLHDGTPFVTSTKYEYNNLNHMLPTKITTTTSKGTKTVTNKYPLDVVYSAGSNQELGRAKLLEKNMLATILETSVAEGSATQTVKYKYKVENNIPVLQYVSENNGSGEENRITIDKWTLCGKPISITGKDGIPSIYLWCNKAQNLAMEIKGLTYTSFSQKYYSPYVETGDLGNYDYSEIPRVFQNIPGIMLSSYKYAPLVGVSSVTDPAGLTTTYDYDSFGRLLQIKDSNGKILEKYTYNYKK